MSGDEPTDNASKDATPAQGSEPAPSTAPKAPEVDIDALAKQVAEQASKALTDERGKITQAAAKEIAARLDPDRGRPSSAPHPLLEEFVRDPEGFISTLSTITKESTTKEIKEAQAQERADTNKLKEMSEEYPEVVKENLDIVDAMFSQVSADPAFKSKSRNDIIEEAVKRTAKRLKIKAMSERSSDDSYRNSMFPGVGSSSSGASNTTSTDSAFDYIKGRREAMQKLKRGG